MGASFTKEQLVEALKAEGVRLPLDKFNRVWRKLDNPQGCEFCGHHVKVAVIVSGKQFTKCCGHAA